MSRPKSKSKSLTNSERAALHSCMRNELPEAYRARKEQANTSPAKANPAQGKIDHGDLANHCDADIIDSLEALARERAASVVSGITASMVVAVDEMGKEWGKHMRYWPSGWPSKNHVATHKKTLASFGNSYAPPAVTSDWLDTRAGFRADKSQMSYSPQKYAGKLKLGIDGWRISASGTSADVYGALRKNPSGGRINNFRFRCSKPLINRFMPPAALRFHRALHKSLPKCDQLPEYLQVMLWVHYILVVVSPSEWRRLREEEKLEWYQVTYKQKVDLLRTTNGFYPKWLDLARKTIAREIEKHDFVLYFKKSPPRSVKGRNQGSAGPLWSCSIFASIHKFPIRHSNVEDLLPVSFSPQGFRNPRTSADFLPTGDNNVFRRENGEIYAVISNRKYGRLYRRGKACSFLNERRENVADVTYCHFDDWHPIKCHPMKIRSKESAFRSVAAVDGTVMIGTRFIVWEKPVPHYNSPEWLKKQGLAKLDECAQQWGRELLESKPTWLGGGKNG